MQEAFGMPILLGLGNHDQRLPFRQVILGEHRILGILAGHSHVVSAAPFAGTLAITAPAAGFFFDPGTTDGLRLLDGAGFNLCTVREGTLIVNPIILPGMQEERHKL
jgi:hypothetical protein